jgi:alkylhydroperoxidase/carboxymuconolactone decarboxylase family protein YurZ
MKEKETLLRDGKIPEKTKWLLLLAASVTQKCPVCIPRAVQHCLDAGWSKEEMLEACMVAVLVPVCRDLANPSLTAFRLVAMTLSGATLTATLLAIIRSILTRLVLVLGLRDFTT